MEFLSKIKWLNYEKLLVRCCSDCVRIIQIILFFEQFSIKIVVFKLKFQFS